jgi:hypothetical protein
MKVKNCLIICLTASALAAFAQQPQPPQPGTPPLASAPGQQFSERLNKIITRAAGDATPEPTLTRFSLDFPGGTPKQLVATIEKAMGKPLNAIVPEEFADTRLPALKMNNVNVPELFQAILLASQKTEAYVTGNTYSGYGAMGSSYQQMQTAYGFRTEGKFSDDSIWYFYVQKPNLPPLSQPKASRFYSLTPYLERGLTVDDITTAIETGWKMQGYGASQPKISFHKETKLLIAVGDPDKLQTIDAVLKALEPTPYRGLPTPPPLAMPAPPLPVRTPKPLETPEAGQ